MKVAKVKNMKSPITGAPVNNQFVIEDKNHRIFQSHETIIAVYEQGGDLTLDYKALEYSQTTSKYLFQFTGLNREGIEAGIKAGFIKQANLNK